MIGGIRGPEARVLLDAMNPDTTAHSRLFMPAVLTEHYGELPLWLPDRLVQIARQVGTRVASHISEIR